MNMAEELEHRFAGRSKPLLSSGIFTPVERSDKDGCLWRNSGSDFVSIPDLTTSPDPVLERYGAGYAVSGVRVSERVLRFAPKLWRAAHS